ncbi:MAG: hypothetical protein O7F12_02075 [Nitrospirae bacterium]|nr:hypothetical protein [Nitrospirota bacterium]
MTLLYLLLVNMKISQSVENNPVLILLRAAVQQVPAPGNQRVSSDSVHISSQARALQSLVHRG